MSMLLLVADRNRAAVTPPHQKAPEADREVGRASTTAPGFQEHLDGLDDGLARHLGRHLGAPIGVAAQHRLAGPQLLVAAGAARNAAGLHRLDSLPQQLARLNDGLVRRSEVLLAAINDATHSLLYGAVLHVDAVDAREAF